MGFFDYLESTDWNAAYVLLTRGDVPLLFQLLAINTIFFIVFIMRKATARHRMRTASVYAVQGILLAANLSIVLQDKLWFAIQKYTIL